MTGDLRGRIAGEIERYGEYMATDRSTWSPARIESEEIETPESVADRILRLIETGECVMVTCAVCKGPVCPKEECETHPDGAETSTNQWACSDECWERLIEPGEPVAWRPIETAPKGEHLLYFPRAQPGRNHWLEPMVKVAAFPVTYPRKPSHWMPLPAAPIPSVPEEE